MIESIGKPLQYPRLLIRNFMGTILDYTIYYTTNWHKAEA